MDGKRESREYVLLARLDDDDDDDMYMSIRLKKHIWFGLVWFGFMAYQYLYVQFIHIYQVYDLSTHFVDNICK